MRTTQRPKHHTTSFKGVRLYEEPLTINTTSSFSVYHAEQVSCLPSYLLIYTDFFYSFLKIIVLSAAWAYSHEAAVPTAYVLHTKTQRAKIRPHNGSWYFKSPRKKPISGKSGEAFLISVLAGMWKKPVELRWWMDASLWTHTPNRSLCFCWERSAERILFLKCECIIYVWRTGL